jgi:hypothetical protein
MNVNATGNGDATLGEIGSRGVTRRATLGGSW